MMIPIVGITFMVMGTITRRSSGRGATKRKSVFLEAWKKRASFPASIYRCKGVVHTAEEPGRRVILQVVGKRVDIAVGDEWNGREPRTRIIAIGAHDGVDGFALLEMVLTDAVMQRRKS